MPRPELAEDQVDADGQVGPDEAKRLHDMLRINFRLLGKVSTLFGNTMSRRSAAMIVEYHTKGERSGYRFNIALLAASKARRLRERSARNPCWVEIIAR
jgi:hypothetical protein